MSEPRPLVLSRDCPALEIPSGRPVTLHAGTPLLLFQSLGGSHTVRAAGHDVLFRVSAADADALGLAPAGEAPGRGGRPSSAPGAAVPAAGPVDEEAVWARLRDCYDPEIPVNIVDLGLVYDLVVSQAPRGGARVSVKMTLTAPGCGMGPAIAADARQKVLRIPGVSDADVQLVWDPPWSADMMSPAGRKALGIA